MSRKKVSHSAWDKYMTCPKLFDIHYNQRLRPSGKSSALAFGSAVDEGLNVLLVEGSFEKCLEIFRDNFKFEDLQDITWDPKDTEYCIIDEETRRMWSQTRPTDDYVAWASMRVKGRMLLEAYYENIYPLIEEVESVQKELSDRPGFIDAVVKLRGYGRVLLDNKTSARPYDDRALANSTQLSLYAQDQGIKKIGFAVMVKQIQKNTVRICLSCKFDGSHVRHKTCPQIVNGTRCHGSWDESHQPKAITQLMVENVQPIAKELISESISQVEAGIEAGVYPRNLKACGKIYGKPCPYINYCWKGQQDGLELKEETKTKEKK